MEQVSDLYEGLYCKYPKKQSYYKISLKYSDDKEGYLSLFTRWVGEEDNMEIRVGDLVNADKVYDDFKRVLKQNIAVLEEPGDLKMFLSVGGHALVNEEIVAKHWMELATPRIAVTDRFYENYISYDSLNKPYTKRYARGVLRMEVFKRDSFRCRICGKSEDDNPDVRLEVHHIQPWSEGGLTYPGNLITLCLNCHDGISIVDRQFLYNKVGISIPGNGLHFFNQAKIQSSLRRVVDYYNWNSLTIKIPSSK